MIRLCYFFLLLSSFVACGKKNIPDEKQPSEFTSNDVSISGITNDDYIVAMNGRLLISPTIMRENEQTYDDLTFEWVIDDKSVSTSKDLDITVPINISNGRKKGKYNVHCAKFNKSYSKDFNVTVMNPYGYGYYFISTNELGKSLLSHINIDNNYDMVFHTSVVGNAQIGDNVHSLSSYAFYDKEIGKLRYKMFITSEKGSTPHIVTENTTLTLLETISSNHNGILFSPKIHVLGFNFEKTNHFFSDHSYMLYENSVLTPKNNQYKFSYLIPGNNDRFLYAFDSSKGKFYAIDTESSHTIVELQGDDLSSEEILGHRLRTDYEGSKIKDVVFVMTARGKKVSLYKISDNRISLQKVVEVQAPASCAIAISSTTWMIGAGNIIYRYDEQQKILTPYFTLTKDVGNIEKMSLSKKDGKLIVSTFKQSSGKTTKGSIIIVEKNYAEKTYQEVIYRCKGITCCDADQW